MHSSWSSYVRSYRVIHKMKQEELASLVNLRQPSISRWENGSSVPTAAEQFHYRAKLEEYARSRKLQKPARPALVVPPTIRALVHLSPLSSLLDDTITLRAVGSAVKAAFDARGETAIGTDIRPIASENVHKIVAEWKNELFMVGSPVLAVSYDDLSITINEMVVRRTWTAVDIGENTRMVFNSDTLIDGRTETDLPSLNLEVLTTEDIDDQ